MSTVSRRAFILSMLALALLAGISSGETAAQGLEGRVRFVIDGDTIVLQRGEKVRYLGVDAPEIGHDGERSDWHAEAAKKANSEMVHGRGVNLRFEPGESDPHGRLLAYVFLPDGTCVNLALLRSGNALVYRTARGFEMLPQFLEAQRKAMAERRGLWGACAVEPEKAYFGNRRTFVLHRPACNLGREMSRRSRTLFDDRWSAFAEGFRPCRLCRP